MFIGLLRQFLPRPGRRRTTARTTVRSPWRVQQLEDRTVPATVQFATGAGPGVVANQVKVFLSDGTSVSFNAFPGFNGGVRVATGDVTGDGITDVVVGAGPGGGPHVKIIDGAALTTPGVDQATIQ